MSISDAFVDVLLDEVPERPQSRLCGLLDWLIETTKPPAGVRLLSEDGGTFSGIVLVEDNRPLLMLAFRTGGTPLHQERFGPERYMRPVDDELRRDRPDTPLT